MPMMWRRKGGGVVLQSISQALFSKIFRPKLLCGKRITPAHHFRTGIVAVAAQTGTDPGEALAPRADSPLHQGQDLAAARRRRLPQHGHDQPAAVVEDV